MCPRPTYLRFLCPRQEPCDLGCAQQVESQDLESRAAVGLVERRESPQPSAREGLPRDPLRCLTTHRVLLTNHITRRTLPGSSRRSRTCSGAWPGRTRVRRDTNGKQSCSAAPPGRSPPRRSAGSRRGARKRGRLRALLAIR
eukprot:scaffold60614_cov107-Phaeocystis_antarctica.AAC.1